jgi:hypothetical protein
MEQIIKDIEESYAPQIQSAQDAVNSAQFELSNLIATAEEKKKSVREYFTALEDKARAETIIAKGAPVI